MTSHVLLFFFVLNYLLCHSGGGLMRLADAAFIADVGSNRRRSQTITTALFSTQPPPRRLLKKVILLGSVCFVNHHM
jgi:hypothetical protein